jgi:hypothetical protein
MYSRLWLCSAVYWDVEVLPQFVWRRPRAGIASTAVAAFGAHQHKSGCQAAQFWEPSSLKGWFQGQKVKCKVQGCWRWLHSILLTPNPAASLQGQQQQLEQSQSEWRRSGQNWSRAVTLSFVNWQCDSNILRIIHCALVDFCESRLMFRRWMYYIWQEIYLKIE